MNSESSQGPISTTDKRGLGVFRGQPVTRSCAGTPSAAFSARHGAGANLRVVTGALVSRIAIQGRRATGVEWLQGNLPCRAWANAEVILTAGSINSPKLLELSGIGQKARLAGLGVDVVHDLQGVGENLQDHLQIRTVYKVSDALTLNDLARGPLGKARIALQYALTRSGPMSMAPSQFGMFTRSGPERATPDLEYHVQPLSTDKLGDPLHPFAAITVSVCNLRPTSVGHVHAVTPDPEKQPEIRLNYLSTAEDRRVAVAAIRQARQIMTARALQRYAPRNGCRGRDSSRMPTWPARPAISPPRSSTRSAPARWGQTPIPWSMRG